MSTQMAERETPGRSEGIRHVKFPAILLQNTSTTGRSGALDLETAVAKELTFLVTVSGGNPTFSIRLEGGHHSAPAEIYGILQTVTAPGFYTVLTHWVRYITADLTSYSGTGTISVTVAAHQEG